MQNPYCLRTFRSSTCIIATPACIFATPSRQDIRHGDFSRPPARTTPVSRNANCKVCENAFVPSCSRLCFPDLQSFLRPLMANDRRWELKPQFQGGAALCRTAKTFNRLLLSPHLEPSLMQTWKSSQQVASYPLVSRPYALHRLWR